MRHYTSRNFLRTPLALLGFIAAVALIAAYQVRVPIALDMASDAEEIYLTRGFYPPEETFNVTYRWTSGASQLVLPGVGSGAPLKLSLNLHEFRPAPLAPQPVTLALNGREIISFTPDVTLQAYTFDLPSIADLRGEAVLDLRSDTFTPKDTLPNSTDERSLGLFIDQIKLDYAPGMIVPPLIVWLLLFASVIGAYGFSQTVGWSGRVGAIISGALLIIIGLGVIAFRTFTAHNAPWLAGTVIAAWLVAIRLKAASRNQQSATPALHAARQRGASVSNPQSTARTPRSALAFIIALVIVWRIALVLIPIFGAAVEGTRECCPEVLPKPVESWSEAAFISWYRWDAIWYGSIARDGYQYFGEREASNVAFFPGFPLLNGAVSRVINLPVEVSGPIVSTVLTVIACWLLYRLTLRETHDDETAQRSIVYFLAFPAAYYLALGFSEALYTVAVLGTITLARGGKWWASGLIAFIAGLTRLHGALLIVPLAYEYLRQQRWQWRSIFKPQAIGALGAPLGVLAFFGYLGVQFGQPLAYFDVQTLFFKGIRAEVFPTFPGTTLANSIHGLLT
ncbi:MAG TPA: mannosyltransferase family protein, partial [Anaerolineae bacterium]|nr:mannosyltransferase family protein [Anaerolineae bacterium]